METILLDTIYECDQATMDTLEFVPLKKYQDNNDYWKYPEDGKWVSNGSNRYFERYTGCEKRVVIDNCLGVSANAFDDVPVEEIVFGASVSSFSTDMIHDCENLKKIIFESVERCEIGAGAIHHCNELSEIEWPHNMDFEQISIYDHCPKLGDMVVFRRLLTCQARGNFYEVDSDLLRINDRAFASCEQLEVVYVPKNVEIIEDNAFPDSEIKVIIVDGQYTQWKAHAHADKHIYVYSRKNSNVMSSVSPFQPHPFLHMKNIKAIEDLLNPLNKEQLVEYCRLHMDKQSDDEMLLKPYGWEREPYQKGWF